MKFDTKIFRSKIARRIFVLFVSCALLPILCLSMISYGHVAKQLNEQSYKRLKQSVKGHGLSLYERLIFLETELQFIAFSLKKPLQSPGQPPLADFKTIFPLVVLMSLWVVLLFSIYYIRKSLIPLELLKKGTRRIAMRDFDCRVKITSRDEFEELTTDFNEMSDRLNRQFKALDTIAEIDRSILSSLESRIIVETVINRMYDWFACDFVAISLIDSEKDNTAQTFMAPLL